MINAEDSLFLVIDVQEKLVKMLGETNLVKNVSTLMKACEILNVDCIVTEQYPKGLGETISEIKDINKNAKYFEKVDFSAIRSEEILSEIKAKNKKQIFLCGIETHICVLQTAEDLLKEGFEVFLIEDACGSRKSLDYQSALNYAKQIGIKILTTEMAVFSLLKTSKNPNFKAVQALIK